MINSIIEAVSITLEAVFGYEIYMEEITQGLKEPCFFISSINPTTRQIVDNRYFRQNLFCIQYFPASEEIKRECNDVAERLLWALEYIHLSDGLLRGTKMQYEVADGVLQFFVNYDCYIYKKGQAEPSMGQMNTKTVLKEGEFTCR